MFNTRRDFIQKSLFLALSSMGSACVTGPSGRLLGLGEADSSRRQRDWLGYNPFESNQIEALFSEAIKNKRIPMALDLPSLDEVAAAKASFEAVKAKYADKKVLALDETYDFMQGAVPLLALHARVHSIDTRSQTSKDKPTVLPNGTISIPPGTLVKMRLKGACLDKTRPAAGAGEKYRFRPSTELIEPALHPLYKAVAQNEKGLPKSLLSGTSFLSQEAMWTLRAVGTNNPLATHPSREVLQHFDRIYPNGAQLFQRTHMKNSFANALLDDLGKQLSFNVNGRTINMADLANPDRRESTLNNMIQDLYRNPVKPVVPSDNRNFQALSDSLASYNLGSAPLETDIAIINPTTARADFDPCDWVLTASSSVAQRVALYPNSSTPITFTPLELYVGNENLAKLQQLKEYLTSKETVDAVKRALVNKTLRDLPNNEIFQKYAQRAIPKLPILKPLIDSMPFVGNALCYWEYVSGKNWLTGKPLNLYEQIGAGFGAIPIAGSVKGVFGSAKAARLMTDTFNTAGLATNLGVTPSNTLEFIKGIPDKVVENEQVQKIWGLLKQGASAYSNDLQSVIMQAAR